MFIHVKPYLNTSLQSVLVSFSVVLMITLGTFSLCKLCHVAQLFRLSDTDKDVFALEVH